MILVGPLTNKYRAEEANNKEIQSEKVDDAGLLPVINNEQEESVSENEENIEPQVISINIFNLDSNFLETTFKKATFYYKARK